MMVEAWVLGIKRKKPKRKLIKTTKRIYFTSLSISKEKHDCK